MNLARWSPTSIRPCRDTGAHRPAAMAKWLRRLGHRVTVLTTSAYGDRRRGHRGGRRPHAPTYSACARGCTATTGSDALFDSDTYSGRPHPLSRVIVPEPLVAAWAPFARRAGAAAESPRAIRLRDHELASRVGPRRRPGASAARRPLGRRPPRRLDLRADPPALSRPRLQRRLDERLERRWLGAADAVVCVSRPAAEDLRERLGIEPRLVPNGWDPDLIAPSGPPTTAPASSTQTGSRSSTPAASAATGAIPRRSSERSGASSARDRSRGGVAPGAGRSRAR